MQSQKYNEYKKEFWNCIFMSPICFFIPLVLAFKEWKPKMDAEKNKQL
ncbi:MAG: hypothetical protein VB100_13950 [Angelakisella sp.]|nr:hypothetical protein [Angelakisella sp.]